MRTLLSTLVIGLILSVSCQASDPVNAIQEQVQEKFIATDGAELFCRIIGQGMPIVVIHGGAGCITQDYLLPYMARLAEQNLLIFYDQRGLGRSTGELTPEKINIQTYVEDIDAIRRSLGMEKISLLGHSWGGFLGMHYAISHPESVENLILLSNMPASSEDFALFIEELTKRLAPYYEQLQEIEASELYITGDPETVAKQLRMNFQTYTYKSEDVNKLNLYKSQQAALNGFKVWEILRDNIFMKPFNLFQELSQLQCPTLIIHGDSDPIPLATAKHINKAIAHSKLSVIEQCGHFPYVEKPEVLFQEINAFLHPAIAQR